MRIGVAIAVLLVSAACSRSDDTQLKQDVRGVGHDLRSAANSIGADSAIKGAGAETRRTAEDAAVALKHTAADTKALAESAADDAKADAQQAGRDTRNAAN
jgi:hypothetical protein